MFNIVPDLFSERKCEQSLPGYESILLSAVFFITTTSILSSLLLPSPPLQFPPMMILVITVHRQHNLYIAIMKKMKNYGHGVNSAV